MRSFSALLRVIDNYLTVRQTDDQFQRHCDESDMRL